MKTRWLILLRRTRVPTDLSALLRDRFARFSREWQRVEPFDWRAVLAILAGGLLLWPLMGRLPMLGYDWLFAFSAEDFREYPPWAIYVFKPLTALGWRSGLALLNGLLLMTVAVATAREARGRGRKSMLAAAVLGILTPPVLILLWEGNIDGIILLGLVALPPGLVYALVKPNLTVWAVLARRQWVRWALFWGVISLGIWGWWPPKVFATLGPRTSHPIAMGWMNLGWPVALIGVILLPFTRADALHLMAAGSFLSPYNMPMHYLLLLPALGRVDGWRRLLLWGWAWTLGLVPMFMGLTKYLALGFPLLVWWFLRENGE